MAAGVAVMAAMLAMPAMPAAAGAQTIGSKLGVELDGLGGLNFVDAAKTLRSWEAIGGGPVGKDEFGWPTADARTVLFDHHRSLGEGGCALISKSRCQRAFFGLADILQSSRERPARTGKPPLAASFLPDEWRTQYR